MSVFSFDAGTSTFAWREAMALRMRVSISAIGSDVVIPGCPPAPSPARFNHAGHLTGERQSAETDAAQFKFPEISARPSATQTAVAMTAAQLGHLAGLRYRQFFVSCNLRSGCHVIL